MRKDFKRSKSRIILIIILTLLSILTSCSFFNSENEGKKREGGDSDNSAESNSENYNSYSLELGVIPAVKSSTLVSSKSLSFEKEVVVLVIEKDNAVLNEGSNNQYFEKYINSLKKTFKDDFSLEINISREEIKEVKETSLEVNPKGDASLTFLIVLKEDRQLKEKEHYKIDIKDAKVEISYNSYEALVRAFTTLRQMLFFCKRKNVERNSSQITLPEVMIEDYASKEWRGVMIDVSRHFFSLEEILRLIDNLAFYKINKLQLHLTDDQGWRMQVDKYPILTTQGAYRDYNWLDRECLDKAKKTGNKYMDIPSKYHKNIGGVRKYGGFYSKEDLRKIIEYASINGIEVIPEIDFPGHSKIVLELFRNLSCNGKVDWNDAFSPPLCLGKSESLKFILDVYKEVIALFPSKYIHIGGDEVDKSYWNNCKLCQARAKKLGLRNTNELQGWLTNELNRFFKKKGKVLIGWDETCETSFNLDGAVAVWWRDWNVDVLNKIKKEKIPVILSPTAEFYMNYDEKRTSTNEILNYKAPVELESVLGFQTNIWTEWIPSIEQVEIQLFPRLMALSQLAWGRAEVNDETFEDLISQHTAYLDYKNIKYRTYFFDGIADVNVFEDSIQCKIVPRFENNIVRYTVDGSMPIKTSAKINGEVSVDFSTDLKIRVFSKMEEPSDVVTISFLKQVPFEPKYSLAYTKIQKGVFVAYKEELFRSCAGLKMDKNNWMRSMGESISLDGFPDGKIGAIFNTCIKIEERGKYRFSLESDDGSILWIGNNMVINNDFDHFAWKKEGEILLNKGFHKLRISYFDRRPGRKLILKMSDDKGTEYNVDDLLYFIK